jgi:hypothetical protein
MERKQACKGNSQTREHKGRHLSIKRLRIWKENKLAKRTHKLESTRGDICQKTQNIERKQACKGNSLPREYKGRYLSEDPENGRKTSLQRKLTS